MDDFLNQTYDRLHRFAIVFEYLVMENAASLKYFQDKFNEMRIYNRLVLTRPNQTEKLIHYLQHLFENLILFFIVN